MSSYLSNLLTTTTSRYNSLRRTLLSSEDDGDTVDDTHICRVLRAYYTEKTRPLPGWLPPDPKARRVTTPNAQYAQQQSSSGYFAGAGGRGQSSTGGGGLSDLWDPPSSTTDATPPGPQSLRNMRRPTQQPSYSGNVQASAPTQARPLPSQRLGTYQNVTSQALPGQQTVGGTARPGLEHATSSAQDRLKARLWGGASATSTPAQQQRGPGGNTYDPSSRSGR